MATDVLENHIDHPVSAETMGVVNIEQAAADLVTDVNNSDNEPTESPAKSSDGKSVLEDDPDGNNGESAEMCEKIEPEGPAEEKIEREGPAEEKSSDNNEPEVARKKTFAEQEAMLNEYLEEEERKKAEAEQPKPRRKTIAEMLKSLPGNLLNKKPMIRPSTKTVIDLDEDFKTVDNNKKKGIEDLMSRFAIHTAVKKPQKEEHYKLHITRREEDSQGLAQFTTDETQYVKYNQEDSDDEGTSPVATAPGSRMARFSAKLMAEIRAKRHKAFEEKVKLHAMYSEEQDPDSKNDKEDEEEEILLDDDMSESDKSDDEEDQDGADEDQDNDEDQDQNEQEEDIEALLDGSAPKESNKKHRKRRVFLEEEASESGGEDHSGDEDEDGARPMATDLDFIDDRPISEDGSDIDDTMDGQVNTTDSQVNTLKSSQESFGFDLEHAQRLDNCMSQDFDNMSQNVDNLSQDLNGISEDLNGKSQDLNAMSQDLFSERSSQAILSSQNSPIPSLLDPCKTPKLTACLLNRKDSPLAPWNSSRFDSMLIPSNNISPLIPRLSSNAALEAFCEDNEATTPTLPSALAKLVGTPGSVDEDFLEGICSARFPSQQPKTPQESQVSNCFGFDEDSFDEEPIKSNQAPSSLLANKFLTDTPKTGEKVARITRLNFEVPAKESEAVDSDDDDDVGVKVIKKRKRKLEFSDDEEDPEGPEQSADEIEAEMEAENDPESDPEDDPAEESEKEYDENEEEIPKFSGFFSKKTGKLRQEFIEAEAELSGSEEGSADEDEKDMDDYEDEAGDAEDIDEEKLREQVGKAHLKQVLDDDQREINFLQEVFFEDGDLHSDGKGRERKFRWKNMDGDQDFGAIRLHDEATGEIPEDELEIRRQKEKLDKIKFLQEHNISVDENCEFEETSQKLLDNSQFMKLGKKTLRKIEKSHSICDATTIAVTTTATTSDQSPEPTFVRKGSFLQRENTLTRLAEMTKVNDNLSALGKGKGFVFTMVTPPSDLGKSKAGASKRIKTQQPKKMLKTSSLTAPSDTQRNSIFKWM